MLGVPERDLFFLTQEEADEAARPHLIVRPGEGSQPRHVRASAEQFAALAHFMGPNGGRSCVPSMGSTANGETGINWRNVETGQELVGAPPPVL